MPKIHSRSWTCCLALCGLFAAIAEPSGRATEPAAVRTRFASSFQDIASPASGTPRVVRSLLTADELAASVDIFVSLKMRNLERLDSLLQAKRTVSRAEMEAEFLPLRSDYDRVAAWLVAEGLYLTQPDASHTTVLARGSVEKIERAFQVSFARVATNAGEFTSSVTVPTLPSELGFSVLGIAGLQPHLVEARVKLRAAPVTQVSGYATPADVLIGYRAPAHLTGAGQTIGIISDAFPLQSDLTTFWQLCGIEQSLANISLVPVSGGPTAQSGDLFEASLNAQWATSIAPGSRCVVFGIPAFTPVFFLAACSAILNNGTTKIVSCSGVAGAEGNVQPALRQAFSQVFMQMAAAGITFFYGSGDGGSNPGSGDGFNYSVAAPVSSTFPSSDPYVTGVGGTTTTFDSTGAIIREIVWAGVYSGQLHLSGGGVSGLYPRPSWQKGPGVPAGATRCVPDVSSMALAQAPTGQTAFFVSGGQITGTFGGTGLAAPSWAAVAALINQARAEAGLPTLGLLGPWIYPLGGTAAFNDITVGSNGAYNAAPGYDVCTGLGTPNIGALAQALSAAPTFTAQPESRTVAPGGSVTFSAVAAGADVTYQWLKNGAPIAGATASTLTLNGLGAADAADYTVVATTFAGSRSSRFARLMVATPQSGRIINLSVRALAGIGGQPLIVGFGVTGASRSLLIRATGPALIPFGVGGTLPDPLLSVHQTIDSRDTVLAANDNWGSVSAEALSAAFASVGAFSLPDTASKDAALLLTAGGTSTVLVSDALSRAGVALTEVYDAGSGNASRLTNVSVRNFAGAGSEALIAGFVVNGNVPKRLLIRGVGPSLAAFGVGDLLADPVMEIHTTIDDRDVIVARNDNWGDEGATALATVFANSGAFALSDPTSKDSALFLTLPVGTYTVVVFGAGQTTGNALLEIYDLQ